MKKKTISKPRRVGMHIELETDIDTDYLRRAKFWNELVKAGLKYVIPEGCTCKVLGAHPNVFRKEVR